MSTEEPCHFDLSHCTGILGVKRFLVGARETLENVLRGFCSDCELGWIEQVEANCQNQLEDLRQQLDDSADRMQAAISSRETEMARMRRQIQKLRKNAGKTHDSGTGVGESGAEAPEPVATLTMEADRAIPQPTSNHLALCCAQDQYLSMLNSQQKI